MLTSVKRFRLLSSTGIASTRYITPFIRIVPGVVFLVIFLWVAVVENTPPGPAGFPLARGFSSLAPILATGLAFIFIVFSLLSGVLLRWRLNRTLSHHFIDQSDVTFTLSENEVQTIYPNCESKLTWNAFTQAAIFDDGALLAQAPGFFWLPYQAIDGEYGQERLIALLKSKFPDLIDRQKQNKV